MIYSVRNYPGLEVDVNKYNCKLYITTYPRNKEFISYDIVKELFALEDPICYAECFSGSAKAVNTFITYDCEIHRSRITKEFHGYEELDPEESDGTFYDFYDKSWLRFDNLKDANLFYHKFGSMLVSKEYVKGSIYRLSETELLESLRPVLEKFDNDIEFDYGSLYHSFRSNGYLLELKDKRDITYHMDYDYSSSSKTLTKDVMVNYLIKCTMK